LFKVPIFLANLDELMPSKQLYHFAHQSWELKVQQKREKQSPYIVVPLCVPSKSMDFHA
jgi:hypothetical protein